MLFHIHPESHFMDHGLTLAHVEWLRTAIGDCSFDGIRTLEVTLDDSLPPVPCDLHGPVMGDAPIDGVECTFEHRGDRAWPTRVCNRPSRETRQITVVIGPHDGHPAVLYTAYGGPKAPREPGDPSIKTEADSAESRGFWARHALSRKGPRP